MCGIVGVLRFGELGSPSKRASALFLAANLLESSETRGKDATGVTTLFDDGNFFVQKMGVSATEFTSRYGGKPDDFEGLMAVLREYKQASLRCFIGHCRKKSAGGLNNVDNHPIKAGNIVGVHNGTLKNQDVIFKNLDCQRDGEVDSEAIFRLLQHYTRDCEDPFTLDMLEETCKRLEGTFSILAFNANNPNQVVSARDGRPAEYCLIKPLGLVVVASETKFIDRAIWSYNKMARLFPSGSPDTTFVGLTQKDVEYGSLPNDTIALFNLTKEITDDTKLSDLYDTRSIPFPTNRVWKSNITTTYSGGYKNRNNTYGSGTKGNGATNNTTKKSADDDDKKSKKSGNIGTTGQGTNGDQSSTTKKKVNGSPVGGRVWNHSMNKFVQAFGKKELVANGVVLDTEGEKTSPLDKATDEMVLDSVDLKTAEEGSNSEVKKTEKAVNEMESSLVEDTKFGVEKYSASKDNGSITVIEPITDKGSEIVNTNIVTEIKAGIERGKKHSAIEREAKDAAIKAAKSLEKFETIFEVADLLDITDTTSLRELPIPALANRILKYVYGGVFAEGYKAGYEAALAAKHPDNSEKLSRAQRHIRILKTLATGIDTVLADDFVDNSGLKSEILNILGNWGKSLPGTTEVTAASIREIFNAGDFRNSEALKRITASTTKL